MIKFKASATLGNGKVQRLTMKQAQAWLAEMKRRADHRSGLGAGIRGLWMMEAFRLEDAMKAAR